MPPHRWQVHSRFTGPFAVQRPDHHQLRRTARFLHQAFAFALGKLGRNPVGSVEAFDRRVAAAAEAQPPSLRRARHIVRLAREQPLTGRPGSEQLHSLGDARQIGLDNTLEAVDLPLPPALHRSAIEPSDPDEHVDAAHVVLGCERGLCSLDDSIRKRGAIAPVHGHKIASDAWISQRRRAEKRSAFRRFPFTANLFRKRSPTMLGAGSGHGGMRCEAGQELRRRAA